MSSTESLKSLVRHVVEEGNRGNLDILQEHPGLQETIPMQRARNEGFSERKVTFKVQFTDGEWVASRIMFSAKQTGEFMGYPATNKSGEYEVLLMHRIVDGKIVKQHAQADVISAMRQFGHLLAEAAEN